MKKLFAILLAVAILASMATVVSAANTTTLTTTVPAATYTLNIPADQEIPFGTTSIDIGSLSVTNASGFAKGKNLAVTLTYDAFKNNSVPTTIPFEVFLSGNSTAGLAEPTVSGSSVIFLGKLDGSTNEYVQNPTNSPDCKYTVLKMNSSDWGKALAGEYTATITFTAEVVVE